MEHKVIEVEKLWFEKGNICILTKENEQSSHPLSWFPKLENATEKQRNNFELSPFGVHWPEIDEDLSYEGFFNYRPKIVSK